MCVTEVVMCLRLRSSKTAMKAQCHVPSTSALFFICISMASLIFFFYLFLPAVFVALTDCTVISPGSYWPSHYGLLLTLSSPSTFCLSSYLLFLYLEAHISFHVVCLYGGRMCVACWCRCVYELACGQQRSTSGIISQKLLTLSWDRFSHWNLGINN